SLLERSMKGDASTLPALKKFLENPAAVEVFGDLDHQAAEAFIAAASGQNLLRKESLTRKLELLRAELTGPNPTPLERMLVERVVACWLQVQDADMRYAQAKNPSIEQGDYYQRRMDRAHRRYLSAIRTLATVRKLALPVLQVNLVSAPVNGASAGPVLEQGRVAPCHHGSNGDHGARGRPPLPMPGAA